MFGLNSVPPIVNVYEYATPLYEIGRFKVPPLLTPLIVNGLCPGIVFAGGGTYPPVEGT